MKQDDQLKLTRLKAASCPSQFKDCPSYLSINVPSARGEASTFDSRREADNSRLQCEIDNFWIENSIKSYEELQNKLHLVRKLSQVQWLENASGTIFKLTEEYKSL